MPARSQTEVLDVASEFRQAYETYRADYDIGGTGRYFPTPRGVQVGGSNADYHYRNPVHYFRAIERARFFDRNNMIIGQAVNRLTANLVQGGFTPDPATGDKSLDDDLKQSWNDWAEDPAQCDYEGERSFYEMEHDATRAIPVDGDVFALPLKSGKLQMLEAHRCRKPLSSRSKNNIHGVTVDSQSAERKSYMFTREDVDPMGSVRTLADVIEIKARDAEGEKQVLHVYWPNRLSQRRGVTAFAPIALPTQYHDDIQFANLVAAQAQSCYAFLEQDLVGQSPQIPPPPDGGSPRTGATSTETLEDGSTRTRQGMAPGMRVPAPPGRSIQGFTPTIPGPQYREHTLIVLSIIGINLDLPLVVLLLDATSTNFSGWRGAIDQARIRFRVLQRRMVARFYCPLWRWHVRKQIAKSAVLRKRDKAGLKDLFVHEWHPPTWSYIEPNKDISANALELATLQSSPRRQRNRQGEDFQDIAPEYINDAGYVLQLAQTEADRLNKQFKLPPNEQFTRQELLHLFTAAGRSVTATDDAPPEKAAPAAGGSKGGAR